MEEYRKLPLDDWTEEHVRDWLCSIRLKKEYTDKLFEEEVTGPALREIKHEFLKTIGMKEGQIQLLISKRDKLLLEQKSTEPGSPSQNTQASSSHQELIARGKASVQTPTDSSSNLKLTTTIPTDVVQVPSTLASSSNQELIEKGKASVQPPTDSSSILKVTSTIPTDVVQVPSTLASSTNQEPIEKGKASAQTHTDSSSSLEITTPTDAVQVPSSLTNSCSMPELPLQSETPKEQHNIDLLRACNPLGSTKDLAISLSLSSFRPFDKEVDNFKYVKNNVLSPETGAIDLIEPCHEYKSLSTAAKLDRLRLGTKFAYEVLRFGCACLNTRTNGTIHFGIVDSKEDKSYQHGQIVGIPVHDKDWFVDALDCIEKVFTQNDAARDCIRPPKFIEVIERDCEEQRFVIEVDIVPDFNLVKGKAFQVGLPKFNGKSNKVLLEKKAMYRRVGAKSEPVLEDDMVQFIQGLQDVDLKRQRAESKRNCDIMPPENLGRKISVLLTNGKQYLDDSLRYILVTNECEENNLKHINFLMRMRILCVFDFDPDSDSRGLCSTYKKHHATNIHSLKSFSTESGLSTKELKKNLSMVNQTTWIFCNGRSNYRGGDETCDENTWIRTKRKYLKKVISLFCDEILPKGYFTVIFLLLSRVEKPIVETFQEFYTELNGVENIMCIAENKEHYEKWASLAQVSCPKEILEQRSVVGMQLSHLDATVQSLFPFSCKNRRLPVSTKGVCVLETPDEERMHTLEILCENECSDLNVDSLTEQQIQEIESTFYRGGKIRWKHFWLAEQKKCEDIIHRDACVEVEDILENILHANLIRIPVARIKVVHHPGSGGSTVARQILWKKKKYLRCAVVKPSCSVSMVCEHAIRLREYDETEVNQCLPVLLLIEDRDEEYIDDLRDELTKAMACKKPCFILLSCKRSNCPEMQYKSSPLATVAITHKLSDKEKNEFAAKVKTLEKQFRPEFIITFVLMSKEFEARYVTDFVEHVMLGVEQSSDVTRLMTYVALLNSYVENSFLSLSHCEAFLGLDAHTKGQSELRQHNFNSCLSEQARLIFIELVEPMSWISSIHIIHPLVAKEVLKQLSGNCPQSKIAMDLLGENVLFTHRFGREEFLRFTRDLFFRRHKISRGDTVDTFLSPLIEHVLEIEPEKQKAIDLLKAAYERFDKDPLFAQQLARLHYKYEKFEDAKKWVEVAKEQLNDSFILDTEGQLYKHWVNSLLSKNSNVNLDEVVNVIEMALKSMDCFRAEQRAAKSEMDIINNSGYFGEVEVGCRLLKLLSTLEIFPPTKNGVNRELLQYLLTDHIPDIVRKPWYRFHNRLKGLHKNIYNALAWISEELSYFQTDKIDDDKQTVVEESRRNPHTWLMGRTKVFAEFFISQLLPSSDESESQALLNTFFRKMYIFKLGGGSPTAILSLRSDKKGHSAEEKLSEILTLYEGISEPGGLDDIDLINYIMCHIVLGCESPGSPRLLSLQRLRDLSKRFQSKNKSFPASAYFLLLLLFWPDNLVDREDDAGKDQILNIALQTLRRLQEIRIKNVPVRKKRTNVLFFMGHGPGLLKLLHRHQVEKLMKGPVNEWRLKWAYGIMVKSENAQRLLKTVSGWTEDGKVYVQGYSKQQRYEVVVLNQSSVPHGSENVTFYLAFSYAGLIAYDLKVQE
ncbi:sterile alpha motif domain-containing protein 9-like [Xenopus laevis]|uniref:Sterile alpha motif domain-containing protein 9-like n=2 Tax=Xenopus laevis TaxID=8355 RepID=A0A1L8EV16_XENLA|nr:sterile alpha motif domain-containing protein 9-like [Xenopus laevis]XP_041432149.1 sterile alpha motif domain-containing protein 9-like [Xenopus laevis]OCT63183.1 hypothetical protein XELAEV_18044281mg [Xenopus laevis]